MTAEHEERRAVRAAPPLLRDDLVEAPVGLGSAHVALEPARRAAQPDASPAPRVVHVVRQGDGERAVDDTELRAKQFERRVERVEARPFGAEAPVLVARPVPLLDTRKMEEAGCEVVLRELAAVDLLPGGCVVRDVVAQSQVHRADRVEHPARTCFDLRRDHVTALRTTRARCTSAGFGSSKANTASTYGGRCGAGASPGSSVIAQRLPSPFMAAGGGASPVRSAYAMRGMSTPH